MSYPWPYNLPIFRCSHRATSPDGRVIAEIDPASEISMGNPTRGTLNLSIGLRLESCNPSFVWSDDSRYLAVPWYFSRWHVFRRQRMAVVDLTARRVLVSPDTACYFQPESFCEGVLTATREPTGKAERVRWRVPDDLGSFKELRAEWADADG
jgi:hypothetical protein